MAASAVAQLVLFAASAVACHGRAFSQRQAGEPIGGVPQCLHMLYGPVFHTPPTHPSAQSPIHRSQVTHSCSPPSNPPISTPPLHSTFSPQHITTDGFAIAGFEHVFAGWPRGRQRGTRARRREAASQGAWPGNLTETPRRFEACHGLALGMGKGVFLGAGGSFQVCCSIVIYDVSSVLCDCRCFFCVLLFTCVSCSVFRVVSVLCWFCVR